MDSWDAITLAEREGKLWDCKSGKFGVFPDTGPTDIYFIPDLHFPFTHRDALRIILEKSKGADVIVEIGDGLDAYQTSSHEKDPDHTLDIYGEADMYIAEFLDPLRYRNPNARIVKLRGNHENRYERYRRKRAQAFRAPQVHDLIQADKYGVEVHDDSGLLICGIRAKHGEKVRPEAGYSARSEMLAHRCWGVSGHTHRYGSASQKDKEGVLTRWWEIGHACDVDQMDYVKNPNWNLSAGLRLRVYPNGEIEPTEYRLD